MSGSLGRFALLVGTMGAPSAIRWSDNNGADLRRFYCVCTDCWIDMGHDSSQLQHDPDGAAHADATLKMTTRLLLSDMPAADVAVGEATNFPPLDRVTGMPVIGLGHPS